MSGSTPEWARWEAATGFHRRVHESVERHRNNAELPVGEYLTARRAELVGELKAKKLIYLDTKHWVSLCNVIQKPKTVPLYNEILGLLEILRQSGRICCPISATLFSELMKQSNPTTRQATARLMDFLSGGVCLQNWLDLAKSEFGRHICRTLRLDQVDEAMFPTWTKVGYWAGEHTLNLVGDAEIDSAVMEKVHIDLWWEMTCDDYQSMPEWTPTPATLYANWVADSEKSKARQAQSKQSIQQLARGRRLHLLEALRGTLFPMLALCSKSSEPRENHLPAVCDPIYEGRDPHALPSLEVVAGLDAAITLDTTRKVQANDMEDYLHAAQALPYCDALFCDNFMAQKLRSKQLNFGKIYQTEIGSRPEEIIGYLKSLT